MALDEFKKSLIDLQFALNQALANKADLGTSEQPQHLLDYKGIQKEYYKRAFIQALEKCVKTSRKLNELASFDSHNERINVKLQEHLEQLNHERNATRLQELIEKINYYIDQFNIPKTSLININSNIIPIEIQSEIIADVDELNTCFQACCYRSAIILCGRLLETVLHRKYYEVTDQDLLEKSPGMGLGNLIAKMNEKGVKLDPGLTNQIHLINQMRIFSVHKKQDAFHPTKIQTNAIILYTLDTIEKLFK
ncbi:hypothetical protein HYV79_01885 [Candidatus Woesearchaeota archaeon]|nr:hypothetical protein [Candidatus Woesearchaeota archaeon]